MGVTNGKIFPGIFMREEKQQVNDLLDMILMPENIREAVKEVKSNHGAPGIDKMPVEDLAGYFALNETTIVRQILNKQYKPLPVRRVYIPKPNSDKLRPLGIPTVTSYYTPPNDVLYKWHTQQDGNYPEYRFLISSRFDWSIRISQGQPCFCFLAGSFPALIP